MRTGRASKTSSLVTMMRAMAHEGVTEVPDFKDPTAWAMLPPAWRLLARFGLWTMREGSRSRQIYFKDDKADVVPLRTRVFDDAWSSAHGAGTRQLVLLGAGLDGRAFRLPNIGDSTVYEVDHPATQELKRRRTRGLSALTRKHVFVPVDFERDRLIDALRSAGLSASEPTFWIWEGVTPYLTRQSQKATLDAISRGSAPRSRVAMTYIEPPSPNDMVRSTARMVRLLGEPFVGLLTRREVAEVLRNSGHNVLADSGVDDWRQRYIGKSARPPSRFPERIAIAERNP